MLADVEEALPPIIVHRSTMQVIDGRHRLRAAVARGEDIIRVRFFEGSACDAFLVAVRENTAHGLPLSLSDRNAATVRILATHGHWSDRAVAEVVGLSAATVGGIRRGTQDQNERSASRVGRDGRVRPVSTAEGRLLAGKLIADMPGASLRQIAQLANISPGTVRDVRARLSRGEELVPNTVRRTRENSAKKSEGRSAPQPQSPAAGAEWNYARVLGTLGKDPTLKYADRGRLLLRLLNANALPPREWRELTEAVPAYSAPMVSQVARGYAAAWLSFADELERNN